MNFMRLVLPAFVALLAVVPASCAQETAAQDTTLAGALAEALPDWWAVTAVELVESVDETIAPNSPPRINPKVPAVEEAGVSTGAGGKPGATAAAPEGETHGFVATLRLTDDLYEPLYSLNGTAIVQPVLGGGEMIEVTGTVRLVTDESAAPTYQGATFDQDGFLELGRPLSAFDFPTVVEGTAEADAFLEANDATRAEGTMRKLMGDQGEEL